MTDYKKLRIAYAVIGIICVVSILTNVTSYYAGRDRGEKNIMHPILRVMGQEVGYAKLRGAGKEVIIFSDLKGAAYIVNEPFDMVGVSGEGKEIK